MDSIILQLQMLGHILLAMGLGAAIGFEREWADKPAGLRTHMLVGGSAALLVSLTDAVIMSVDMDASLIRSDPVRIIEAIITGISFLGAGTILRRRNGGDVEGLTTAASLLFVAGIGVAVAASQYVLAVGATLLGLGVLYVMKSFAVD
ncbi:MAG: MgtC/SapB family protein [Caldilineaceae bacterium]